MRSKVDYFGGLKNNPIQAVAAYAQTAFSERFQTYTKDWFKYVDENDTYPKTELMDFGLVKKMQIAMYIGLFDNTCT